MVYSGFPSKACAECRLRRTKCDTKRPSCSQCVRAGRTCKGYRDPADLMFRDESEGQVVKHQRRKAAKKDPQEPAKTKVIVNRPRTLPTFDLPTSSKKAAAMPAPLVLGLSMSAEDQATCYFFHNYVLEKDQFVRGNFQYLSEVYSGEEVGGALSDSVTSLGLVGLANFWHSPNILSSATAKYNSALRQISTMLKDVEVAKADQTLIAVMLLGLYETNTCCSRQSMQSWSNHVNGAAALLRLRGKAQLQTSIGHHLFVHLRGQVITCCIQRHVPVPESINEWSNSLESETPEEAAATALSRLSIKYCNLRSSMSFFHDYSDPDHIISTACAIDAEYAEWARSCPIQYIYNTVTLNERSDEVYSDHYHVYSNIWVATIWNHYRSVRILLNELILDQTYYVYRNIQESALLWNDTSIFENQILASNATLLQLSQDICSSVPYFLGFNQNSKSTQTPKTVNGNLLLWPLYTAACTDLVSGMMRDWVAGRLRWISEVMGIRQATPLAYTLSIKQDLLEWQAEDTDSLDGSEPISLSEPNGITGETDWGSATQETQLRNAREESSCATR